MTAAELQQWLSQQTAAAVLFSTPDCGVCVTIKPKLQQLFKQQLPRIAFLEVNLSQMDELATHFGLMAAPTLVFYFDGKETLRYTRNFSLEKVTDQVSRLYTLYFD